MLFFLCVTSEKSRGAPARRCDRPVYCTYIFNAPSRHGRQQRSCSVNWLWNLFLHRLFREAGFVSTNIVMQQSSHFICRNIWTKSISPTQMNLTRLNYIQIHCKSIRTQASLVLVFHRIFFSNECVQMCVSVSTCGTASSGVLPRKLALSLMKVRTQTRLWTTCDTSLRSQKHKLGLKYGSGVFIYYFPVLNDRWWCPKLSESV